MKAIIFFMSLATTLMLMSATLPRSTLAGNYGWITTNISNLHPENIDWSPVNDIFITGSSLGFLYSYTLAQNAKIWATLTYPLFGTGVQVDVTRNQLYHTQINSTILFQTYTTGVQSILYRLNLTTGSIISYVDLSNYTIGATPTFLNDVIMDSKGNLYVTDSINARIYIVFPNNTFAVFVQSPLFNLSSGGVAAADGIELYNNNLLIVSKFDTSELYTIPLSNPSNINKVSLDNPITHPDGIFLDKAGVKLFIAGNLSPNGQLYIVTSSNGWNSGNVINYTDPLSDTAGVTLKNGTTSYVCHLNFFGGDPNSYVIEPIPPIAPPNSAYSFGISITFVFIIVGALLL